MIIGKDLQLQAARDFCIRALREGHEIGNHTWSHPTSFGSFSYEEKKREIARAHRKLTKICGKELVGFRGPGYYVDDDIRDILKELRYAYDASILPGFAQLLMSMYARMCGGENKEKMFGRGGDLFSKITPYKVDGIWELPVSVLPLLRFPIHTTFAYIFGSIYRRFIVQYLHAKPSYVLYVFHAIDFVDLPKKDGNYPVVPLRYSFKERLQFANTIVDELVLVNGEPLKTSERMYTTCI